MSAPTPGPDVVHQPTMTKAERTELASLARMRGKLAKDQVDTVAAERVAQAESQLSAIFASDDVLWKAAADTAKAAIDEVNRVITEQWEAAGQPPTFAPSAHFAWAGRGENFKRERRAELRTTIRTRIAADAKHAKTVIESATVEVRTKLVADGLTSDAAHAFLEGMPQAAALLPRVDVEQLQGELTASRAAKDERTLDDMARWLR